VPHSISSLRPKSWAALDHRKKRISIELDLLLVLANISHLKQRRDHPCCKTADSSSSNAEAETVTADGANKCRSAVKMKSTATSRKKSAAKTIVSDLPAGQALESASLSVKSKKRKHRHSIEYVDRSDNAVGDWKQRADGPTEGEIEGC
jgi:hypothetical protein